MNFQFSLYRYLFLPLSKSFVDDVLLFYLTLTYIFITVGSHLEDMTTGWPANWTWTIQGFSPILLPLQSTLCPPFHSQKLAQRTTTWELCVLRLFGRYMWLNPVKTFKTLLVAECEDLLVLWLLKTNLKYLSFYQSEVVCFSLQSLFALYVRWGGGSL